MEVVKAFEKASSKSIPYTITAKRPGDIGVCYANPSKAKKELNFQAIRGIETMCEDAWRWQLNNPNGYGKLIKIMIPKESLAYQAMGLT